MTVTWTASCPACGRDVTWSQTTQQGQFGIQAGDITIHCRCDVPHAA